MIVNNQPQLGHLGYCTNIHAGESWPELIASLRANVPKVREQVSPQQQLGIGLRVGAKAAQELTQSDNINELLDFLQQSESYVFTINGFPYGPFHAQSVKENVYAPDWSTPERLSYTNSLADLLVKLLVGQDAGSISTVPGTFKPWSEGRLDAIANNLLEHVAYLFAIKNQSGKHISLALEPEPFCLLETIDETTAFFKQYLLSDTALGFLGDRLGLNHAESESVIRQHIGVCYDVCHAAVEYEDPVSSIDALRDAGIEISKIQLSSALRIESVGDDVTQLLAQFNEPVYLHQVIQRRENQLVRYLDLPQALQQAAEAKGSEWRVHFHVPIFLEQMTHFDTTQFFLKEILALHRKKPITNHLEVETYTWDVLPEKYRNCDLPSAIARELKWVVSQLDE